MTVLEASWVLEGRVCTGASCKFDCVLVIVHEAQAIRQAERLLGAARTDCRAWIAWHIVMRNITRGKVACAVFVSGD